jgi:tetratricopeptide (TPR) repeat protein
VRACIEAGEAALAAGVAEAGWRSLRRAVSESGSLGDPRLTAEALLALGRALIHAVRGRDEEGASALHEAVLLAEANAEWDLAASALRELGYVDVLQGRYERVRSWLQRAQERAGEDLAEQARIRGLLGMSLCDTGCYHAAIEALRQSVSLARETGDLYQVAQSLSHLGRAHLLRGEVSSAVHALDESLLITRAQRWTAFSPWPECLRAEADLLEGRSDEAAERFQHALALASQLDDPCWEGTALRGLGLVGAARREPDGGLEWLLEARRRASSDCDTYQWIHANVLDSLCDVAVDRRLPAATEWIGRLDAIAGHCGMREFLVRAQLHRGRLGQPGAFEAAAFLAHEVDNPALHARVASLASESIGRVPGAVSRPSGH